MIMMNIDWLSTKIGSTEGLVKVSFLSQRIAALISFLYLISLIGFYSVGFLPAYKYGDKDLFQFPPIFITAMVIGCLCISIIVGLFFPITQRLEVEKKFIGSIPVGRKRFNLYVDLFIETLWCISLFLFFNILLSAPLLLIGLDNPILQLVAGIVYCFLNSYLAFFLNKIPFSLMLLKKKNMEKAY